MSRPTLHRWVIVTYRPAPDRQWYAHPERQRFVTRSGAEIYAARATRITPREAGTQVEWFPRKLSSYVHNYRTETRVQVSKLPVYKGIDS